MQHVVGGGWDNKQGRSRQTPLRWRMPWQHIEKQIHTVGLKFTQAETALEGQVCKAPLWSKGHGLPKRLMLAWRKALGRNSLLGNFGIHFIHSDSEFEERKATLSSSKHKFFNWKLSPAV